MPSFTPDSDCIIAALDPQHPHHHRAWSAIASRLERGHRMVLVGHKLLEAYAVLTRLPLPHRVSPLDAWNAIKGTFVSTGTVVGLTPEAYLALMGTLAEQGIAGGQVYDTAIAACAWLNGADSILAFNERHFQRFVGNGLSIEVP